MPVMVSATDNRLRWEGALSVEYGSGWVQPWRLPFHDLALYPHMRDCAAKPSSVRLRFATDAVDVAFLTEPLEGRHTLDLYADNELIDQCLFKPGADRFVFSDLPPGWNVLELWLPPSCPFRLRSVVLSDGASVEEALDNRPRWVTYGSSITHCASAGSGATTWPAYVARTMGLHLTSFGFGGQCHMDPMMARLIRSQPADVISLKIGINICGQWSLNQRTFLPAALGTVATIREGHPETPLVVCSPIFCPGREQTHNDVGMNLEMMRELLREAVEIYRARGDRHIHYADGLKLFGPDLAHLLPDALHPNAEGYLALGRNFAEQVFDKIGVGVPVGS